MSIAVIVKVHDGVVLAADSASTIHGADKTRRRRIGVLNVYNNANKVFNLCDGIPIGITYVGIGGIGEASIGTLLKDLRKRFNGKIKKYDEWKIKKGSKYTINKIAELTKKFIYEEHYKPEFEKYKKDEEKPGIILLIAGYSEYQELPELWKIQIKGDSHKVIQSRPKKEHGINWEGQPEAIHRLILGFGTGLPSVLKELKVPEKQIPQVVEQIKSRLEVPLHLPAMPMQDAIDLARYLIELSIGFYRFLPGPPTVGGPIEIAAITKHEGFNWISRNYFCEEK